MIIRMKKEVSLKEFYMQFLMHTSINLPHSRQLTEREREVLTEIWLLEDVFVKGERISPSTKRYLREKFKYTNYSNLDNFLKSLKDKGFLVRNEKGFLDIRSSYNLPRTKGEVRIEYLFDVNK